MSFKIGTDYDGSTVTGAIYTLNPAQTSPSGTDWDAFYLPAGSCSKRYQTASKGMINVSYVNHLNTGGSWVKFGNGFWHVIVKNGSCPA